MSRAAGPHKAMHAIDGVTSRTTTDPSVGACCSIHERSWRPKAVPVTIRNRSTESRVTVTSHSMPPRLLSIDVYVIAPTARSTWLAQTRSRKAAAPGPVTSILAKLDSSNSPAAERVARCSVTMAVDQC